MADDEKRSFIHRVNPGGRGAQTRLCYADNVIITGFAEIPEAGSLPTYQALQRAIKRAYPNEKPKAHIGRGAGFFRFLHEMTPGTLIASPDGEQIHIARIDGVSYVNHDEAAYESDSIHRIPVVWLTDEHDPPTTNEASDQLRHAIKRGSLGATRRTDFLRDDLEALLRSRGIDPTGDEDELLLDTLIVQQHPRRAARADHMRSALRQDARRRAEALASDAEPDDRVAHEGSKIGYAVHRGHERNRKIVADKKAWALKQYGRLACEACPYDFKQSWDLPGGPYIEAHHLRHLSDGARQTRLADLALLCANCHRAIHRLPSGTSIAELKRHMLA